MSIEHRLIQTNGIRMHIAEAGAGRPVVLCHGFPELWYSWRHQIPALAAAGFRVIAPDLRGYGQTDAPEPIESYDMATLTADLAGLLDAAGEEQAHFVGHDWGAALVWQMAARHPQRVRSVTALSVPHSPRGSMRPTDGLRAAAGDRFQYILYFQKPGVADAELAENPRQFLARFLWTISGDGRWKVQPKHTRLSDALSDPTGPISWLTDAELDVYAHEFERTGFTGGLNWYRNIDRTWETSEHLSDATITCPALFIAGDRDPVIRGARLETMRERLPGLRDIVVLEGAGHWTQQEVPSAVNDALLAFLS